VSALNVVQITKAKMPQVEDGFTRIANELLDAILFAKLTTREMSVLMAIIRKTYGYNKKEDDISASQIGDLSGMARTHVTNTLNILAKKRIINKRQGVYGCVVGVQKDYSQWLQLAKDETPVAPKTTAIILKIDSTDLVRPVPILAVTSTDSVQVDSTESVHTKDNLPKDKQKTSSSTIALHTYLEHCKSTNTKPIPENDAVFKYAEAAGIPDDFLRLHWLEFKDRYTAPGAKRQKSWPQTFRNSVRGNWYKIWYASNDGGYSLTTTGQQAKKIHQGKI
jgi:phage replication O-like protein O